MRVLLVEDDSMVGRALRMGLQQDGHATDWVQTAGDARVAWISPSPDMVPYDAVIVDLGLPDGSGLDLIREARSRGLRSAVIVVTARDRVSDRIAGLDVGADDYMVKPVDLDELAARLRAVDRRLAGRTGERLVFGPLVIDAQARAVQLHDVPVDLSAREFAVLMALARRPGATVSRTQIEDTLYGWDEAVESNTIEVHIHRLRRKLGAQTIETLRGLGYRLVVPSDT